MTLELSPTTQEIHQKTIQENVVFLDFLIDLYDIAGKAPFDKIDTTDNSSFREIFPTFKKFS
jgi:hypothetical protein